jgi:uncharacterized protein (TIRG00374 family)
MVPNDRPVTMAIDGISENVAAETQAPPLGRGRGLRRIPKGVSAAAQAIIGVGALVYIVAKSNPHQLSAAIKATHISYLPLSLLATLAVMWLMAYRWNVILSAREHKISTTSLFVYYLIGSFFSNFVPGGSVSIDVVRLVYVDKQIRDKAYVLTTLLYDRFVGLFVLLFVGLGAALVSRSYLPNGVLTRLIEVIMISAVLISSFLLSQWLSDRLSRLVVFIGGKIGAQKVAGGVARSLDAMAEIRSNKSIIVWTVVISLLSRLAWTMVFYVTARAMDLPIGLALIFAFISIIDLIRQLPVTPNGLGLREGALVLLLGELGIAREQALMFSFLAFAPLLLCAIAGGVVYVVRSRIQAAREK